MSRVSSHYSLKSWSKQHLPDPNIGTGKGCNSLRLPLLGHLHFNLTFCLDSALANQNQIWSNPPAFPNVVSVTFMDPFLRRYLVAPWESQSFWSWLVLVLAWLCSVRCQHEGQQRMDECIQQVLGNLCKSLHRPTQHGVLCPSSGACT